MNSFSFEGKFERVPPANFAEKIGIPSGWMVVNHNYISNKAHRRVAHGEWFEISSDRAKIYRLLRFSPRLQKGDETKSGQIVVDWIGWIDLHDRDENVSDSISLKVRRLPWWRRPLAYLKHPDPAVRLSGWLGWASVILGSIALLLALPYAWIGQKLGALASATCFMLALTCGEPIPAGPTSDAGSTSTELGTEVPAAPPVEQPQITALDRGSNELHFSSLACEDHLPYGAPAEIATPDGDRVTVCQWSGDDQQAFFVSRYDRSRVSTDWTAYTLTREMMLAVAQSEIVRREHGVNFQRDPQIETESFRSPVHGSLTGIGNLSPAHDRGHCPPSAPMAQVWGCDLRRICVSSQ